MVRLCKYPFFHKLSDILTSYVFLIYFLIIWKNCFSAFPRFSSILSIFRHKKRTEFLQFFFLKKIKNTNADEIIANIAQFMIMQDVVV